LVCKQGVDGGSERRKARCGCGARFACAGLPLRRIAVNEQRAHAEAASELDIDGRVANHDAGLGVDCGKVALRLEKHAGERLAAVAGVLVMGAEVEGVNVRAVAGQLLLELRVDGFDVGWRVEAERGTALVGDDEDAQPGAVEACDGVGDARQQVKLFPACDVAALGELAVHDAVAIKENSNQGASESTVCGQIHLAMIATTLQATFCRLLKQTVQD